MKRLSSSWKRSVAVLAVVSSVSLGGCRAEQPWPLWQKYEQSFVDTQGRVIDHLASDRTTSEGQAYGMFFCIVVNDKDRFDKLLKWTEENLAQGDLTTHLPAWSWGKATDGSWRILDANSASDADLWLAYDLLEGGRVWHDQRYEKLGQILTQKIAHSEVALVNGIGTVLLPAPQGFHPGNMAYVLNPSYAPPQVLARLAISDPGGPWNSIADSLPELLAQGSPNGFAMDWILAGANVRPSPTPAELAAGKNDATAYGSYDAIRVYLWLGLADRGTRGVERSAASVSGMAGYLQTHPVPPLQVDGTGRIANENGSIGFSAAVIPYLISTGHAHEAKTQMDRLTASLGPTSGLYGNTPLYYDQNLALFANGWVEQRFRFDRDGRLKLKWK